MSILKKEDPRLRELCVCGHTFRIHSKKDGQCLGMRNARPKFCECEQFEPKVIEAVNEKSTA